MFCADYIASFIHHGLIVGLWFEYNERSGRQDLTSAYVPPVHSVLAGCLAGLCGAASVYPFDFVRQGAIITEKVGFRHSLSTVPYAGAYFGLYFSCRDRERTASQAGWALLSSSAACLAEIPFDKAKQAMMGSRRTMVFVNMLYVPFGALMLVMYDKAMTKVTSSRYSSQHVATIKLPTLLDQLRQLEDCKVKVVLTQNSRHFLEDLSSLGSLGDTVLTDEDEWRSWRGRGDPVLHIELRRWADLCLVAPLSANSLAKLSNGLADNLLTSTLRAWDLSRPVVVAPAMNTFMWEHPVTRQQLDVLTQWGYTVIPPVVKILVCGDQGNGAMASVESIVDTVKSLLIN